MAEKQKAPHADAVARAAWPVTMTPADVALALGVTPQTAREWMNSGELGLVVRIRGRLFIRAEVLKRRLAELEAEAERDEDGTPEVPRWARDLVGGEA